MMAASPVTGVRVSDEVSDTLFISQPGAESAAP